MTNSPKPPFTEKEIKELTTSYKQAVKEIKSRLSSIDPTNKDTMTEAFLKSRLAEINHVMEGLKGDSKKWAESYIPKYAKNGASSVFLDLGLAKTQKQADQMAKLSTLNTTLLQRRITSTQNDLLRGIDRSQKTLQEKVKTAVNRANKAVYGSGLNDTPTIRNTIADNLRKDLAKIGETEIAIVDSSSGLITRRFKIDDYADIVARTQAMNTYHEHTIDKATGLGTKYARISTAIATKDACEYHQGRIVKLDPTAEGDYPFWEDLKATGQIFHPRCRHRLLPLDNPNDLTEEQHRYAMEQAERGKRATDVKTPSGKPSTNPKILDKKMDKSPLPTYKDNRTAIRSVEDRVNDILARNGNVSVPPLAEVPTHHYKFTPQTKIKDLEAHAMEILPNMDFVSLKNFDIDVANDTVKTAEWLMDKVSGTDFKWISSTSVWKKHLEGMGQKVPRVGPQTLGFTYLETSSPLKLVKSEGVPIILNRGFRSASLMQETFSRLREVGWSVNLGTNTTKISGTVQLLTHEYGHVVDRFLRSHHIDLMKEHDFFNKARIERGAFFKSWKKVGNESWGDAKAAWYRDHLSEYGYSSSVEFFAEAFTQYMLSSDPAPLVMEFGQALETSLSKIYGKPVSLRDGIMFHELIEGK